ncbi:hypothetical protein [Streptomyces sp. UNOC14_S4]|uniref:hypothetical protein n=1 Tax=Streptomyces sp. UNOC14_S4 TaxID=2872340 RepID=UPI001E340B36|nr:hypothetical protein [Streptomyces sp. UNOC14_S4]MCC3767921.1 hypothetical protein [Streptomyces sp. UNOC14_S4]
MPELVQHGHTGLLADSEDELAQLLAAADGIDPRACRSEAVKRFTPAAMADGYLRLYEETLRRGTQQQEEPQQPPAGAVQVLDE